MEQIEAAQTPKAQDRDSRSRRNQTGPILTLGIFLAGAAFLAATHVMESETSRLTGSGEYERIAARNRAMESQLVTLDRTLHEMTESLIETHSVMLETRDLVGLESGSREWHLTHPAHEFAGPDPEGYLAGPLACSSSHINEALLEARHLRRSFAEIVASMERNAEIWATVPSTRPVEGGRISSRYGMRRDPFTGKRVWHRGMDLSVPAGTPVVACAEGMVIRSGWYGGYGKMVEVDHGNGLHSRYAHNSRLVVPVGQRVRRGELLAYVGSTGRANAPHLHYEVRLNGKPVNPEPYMLPPLSAAE